MPKSHFLGLLASLALLACSGASEAETAPDAGLTAAQRPDGLVTDEAQIFSAAFEVELAELLQQLLRGNDVTLVVATTRTLGDQPINEMANELFNGWGIGSADSDRGLLVLIAPNDQQVRIEVGCGLESAVTNNDAGRIIGQDMLPLFRENKMEDATMQGVEALIGEVITSGDAHPTSRACLSRNSA